MMTQTQAAAELRELAVNIGKQLDDAADALTRSAAEFRLPRSQYTIAEAHATLRAVLPGKSFCIELSMWNRSHSKEVESEWRVWDGSKGFDGKTLEESVNACIAAHDESVVPFGKTEELLTEAQADEHPDPDDVRSMPATAVG